MRNFNRHWNRTIIKNIVEYNNYLYFMKHENLKALSINLENVDSCMRDWSEMIFIVPEKWLKDFIEKEFNVNNMEHWLKYEYTIEQTEIIFAKALGQRQIVMVDFK